MVSINSIPTQKHVPPKQIPFSWAQYIYIFKSVSNNTHTLLCIIFFCIWLYLNHRSTFKSAL